MTITPTTVYLRIEAGKLGALFPLLQNGFMIRIEIGSSIETLLCERYGLDPDFVEERISTVFLDGRPVDDIGSTTLQDGSILALSAAMPGLVGATFRRGGYLAPFRNVITYRPNGEALTGGRGLATIKLFNLLIKELGPAFLHQGVYFTGEGFQAFMGELGDDFWAGCKSARLNDHPTDPGRLGGMNWPDNEGLIKLRIDLDS